MKKDFLLELGCEEIPATMIPETLKEMESRVKNLLTENQLGFGEVTVMGTPRRLTIMVKELDERQPDTRVSVVGPPKDSAFLADGTPGKAAVGFARAQNISINKLKCVEKNGKEFLAAVRVKKGKRATEIIPVLLQKLFSNVSFPKTMRWGDGNVRFVRPVRSLLVLFGKRTIGMELFGVRSTRYSFTHRILGDRKIKIEFPAMYREQLKRNYVIIDHRERGSLIHEMLQKEAAKCGCKLVMDDALLEEVNFMVEYPSVISGEFDPRFLGLPEEILVTTLRHHQKCFSLRKDGEITNRFLSVINNKKERTQDIIRGMERITEGRLSDAEFYWNEDREVPMEKRIELLHGIQFHEKLGAYAEKVQRIASLAFSISTMAGVNETIAQKAEKAALLSKADLTTEMVKDFPELQGIMGAIYARCEGIDNEIAEGIYEHYLPMSMEDESPKNTVGAILSIADKMDTIIGCFGIGLIPSGSRDPFGLRRAAHGILKVCIERGLSISIETLVGQGIESYRRASIDLEESELKNSINSYFKERMRYYFEAGESSYDTVNAVLAAGCDDPLDVSIRVKALSEIRKLEDFEALAVSHKRIRNIVFGQERSEVRPDLFTETDEKALYEKYREIEEEIEKHITEKNYLDALRSIATMRKTLDRFFDTVLVMAEDADIRKNRITLLSCLSDLFMRIADFSEIVVSGP